MTKDISGSNSSTLPALSIPGSRQEKYPSIARQHNSSPHAEISVLSGQYHFVTAEGWKEEWTTETPGEWWQRHLWIKAGGHKQEETDVGINS